MILSCFARSFACVAVASVALVGGARAEVPDLFHTFEEDGGEMVVDSAPGALAIRLPESSRVSTEQHRFGKGALLINERPKSEKPVGLGWETLLTRPEQEAFKEEIRKCTVTAWVKPEGIEPFIVFWRIPGATYLPGYLQFSFLGGEKGRFYASMTGAPEEGGEKGKGWNGMSSLPASLPPGEWSHLAMVFDEGEVRFYLNGAPLGVPLHSTISTLPAMESQYPSMKAFSGVDAGTVVDDFALFGSRALTDEEIAAVYEHGLEAFVKP